MLPPIDTSLLPADVRDAGEGARNRYLAALGFEKLLVQELARTMLDSVEGEESSAATSMYRQMLPETLADSIMASGGLGLAPELYRSLEQRRLA